MKTITKATITVNLPIFKLRFTKVWITKRNAKPRKVKKKKK